MSGVCYKKGSERGLWYEIQCIQEVIDSKTSRDEDCTLEKKLLKSYKKYTEVDYKNHKLITAPSDKCGKSKSGRVKDK